MSDERKDVTITVRVDRSLKAKMDKRPEINWSGVSRKAIRETIEDLEVMDEIASRNRMTEADAKEIADRISEDANERALRLFFFHLYLLVKIIGFSTKGYPIFELNLPIS